MPNLGGGKARCNLRDVPMVNSLFLIFESNSYTCTHVHISEIKIGGGGRKQSVRIIGDSKIANAHD